MRHVLYLDCLFYFILFYIKSVYLGQDDPHQSLPVCMYVWIWQVLVPSSTIKSNEALIHAIRESKKRQVLR